MDDTDDQKKRLRAKFSLKRQKLDDRLIEQFSIQILSNLLDCEFYKMSETVHCFMSIKKNCEVDTGPIIKRMLDDGKRVVVPKANPEKLILDHYLYRSQDAFQKNRWGIPEPADGIKVSERELDLVLVPMLAADCQKNRLGYGMGYYDRFLADLDVVKAGLLFEVSISDVPIPYNTHDIRMDYLITEKKVY